MNPERLEVLVNEVRSIADAAARDSALELVQAVMELHRESLDRLLEIVAGAETGGALMDAFAHDAAVSRLLLLHDLHPLEMETRVRRALADPALRARGARAELIAVRDGVVQLRVEGGGPEFGAAVRHAITEAAPDAAEIVIESDAQSTAGFIPVERLFAGSTT